MTEAIELRDKEADRGFPLYEFNRALTRILLYGTSPPPDVREAIETDLKAAEASPYLRKTIAADPDITAFRSAATP